MGEKNINHKYQKLLINILTFGIWRDDPNRKGTKRLQIPAHNIRIDLRDGFPLINTKKMWWKGIVIETLWMLRGDSNIGYLVDNGVDIWNKDAYNYYVKLMKKKYPTKPHLIHSYDVWLTYVINRNISGTYSNQIRDYKYGDIGDMYGKQWRNFNGKILSFEGLEGKDQLKNTIKQLIENPLSSNHTIFGDNPSDRDSQALPCCMNYMQFMCEPIKTNFHVNKKFVERNGEYPKYYLDLSINYRSWDVLLGAPWNIAQYSLILHIIGKITGYIPRYLHINANNVHLYDNQIDAAKEHIGRDPRTHSLPHFLMSSLFEQNGLTLQDIEDVVDYKDFKLKNYKSYSKLNKQPEMKSYE